MVLTFMWSKRAFQIALTGRGEIGNFAGRDFRISGSNLTRRYFDH